MNMDEILSVTSLSFSYGKKEVLQKLSLSLRRGEIYGLAGKNGSGKSTLIRLLLGLHTPPAGAVFVAGADLCTEREKALEQIAGMPEEALFYPHLTGAENLTLAAALYGKDESSLARAKKICGLGKELERKTRRYSFGMKKRLGIAMTLLKAPSVLVLDEPMQGLDPEGILTLRELLLAEKAKDSAVFLAGHSLREMELFCDRIGFLHEGKLAREWKKGEDKSPEELFLTVIRGKEG